MKTTNRAASIRARLLNRARAEKAVPAVVPMGLSGAFVANPIKQQQWRAFLSESKLEAPSLDEVVVKLRPILAFDE